MTQQNAINLVPDFPTSHVHLYGYGTASNGLQSKSIEQNTATGYEFYRYSKILSSALYDVYEFDCFLKAGSYNFEILYDRDVSRGTVRFYLNDTVFGSALDCYNATRVNVNRYNQTISIAQSGKQNFKIKTTGKNASSSNYHFGATAIFITPVVTPTELRIRCGFTQSSNYLDSLGKVWIPDSFFSGGNWWDIEAQVGTAITIQNTSDQSLYKFERSLDTGSFSYTIPVATGTYTLKLHFCENVKTATGQRVGTIALNGSNILSNFDIFADAGGQRKALIKTFTNQSLSSFTLNITNTLINGIELIRTA